jgi:hypothetical protein
MRSLKYLAIVLLSLLLSTSAWAQKNELLNSFSPNLQKFLEEHPEDSMVLAGVLSEAFTNRTVSLYYFYSGDESVPRAAHFYPNDREVRISVKTNQQPADEFFCVIFESINSEGEKRFKELASEARSGTISKTNYAMAIVRQEFEAVKRTRDLVGKLKFTKEEMSSSHYYNRFLECPDGFNDYLDYVKRLNQTHRDMVKEYEAQYDLIRKPGPSSRSPP